MGLINSIELAVSGEKWAGLLCRLLRLDAAIRHVKQSIHQRSELSYVLNSDIPGCRNPDISLVGIAQNDPDTTQNGPDTTDFIQSPRARYHTCFEPSSSEVPMR